MALLHKPGLVGSGVPKPGAIPLSRWMFHNPIQIHALS